MDLSKIELAIDKAGTGLEKYLSIMQLLNNVDVSKDMEFQKRYNGFYRMRQRKAEFYEEYFNYLESNKNNRVSFKEVLTHFYNKFSRIEASFSSKLAATIDTRLPVWDTFVLQNLGLKKPPQYCKDRLKRTIELYADIQQWYSDFMATSEGKNIIEMFNRKYPGIVVSDIKKVDFVLWQMR